MAMASPPAAHRRSRFIELCSRPSSPSLDVSSISAATDTESTSCAHFPTTSDNSSTTKTLTTTSTSSASTSNIATPSRPQPIHRSSHPELDVTLEQVLADHEAWGRKRDKRASTASWGSFSGLFALENGNKVESRSESRSGRRVNMTKGPASEISTVDAKDTAPPAAERMERREAAAPTTQPRRPPIYHSTSSFTSASGPKHAQSYQRASIRTVSTATNQSSQTTSSVASGASGLSTASSRTTASRSSAATSFSSSQPSRRSSLSAAFGLGKGRGLGGSLRRKGAGVWRSKERGGEKEGDVVVLEIEEARGEEEVGEEMAPMMVTGRVRPKSEMGMLSTPALALLGEERQPEPTSATKTAKNDTVPLNDGERESSNSTEVNVALALAKLTQPAPSEPQSYPAQTEIHEECQKSNGQTPLPAKTQTTALAMIPASKVAPHADASQAAMQAKAKTKGSKRWSRILPWK